MILYFIDTINLKKEILGIPLTQVAQDVVWQPEWTITLGT